MEPYIPYFQTTRYRVEAMMELADIKPGEKAADLGSGDGRIVIALAQKGAEAHGYELDKTLVELSRKNIQTVILGSEATPESDSGQARMTTPTIHQTDFWQEDLGQYDIICVYPMPDIMEALEKKLQKELRPDARVLLNYYPFPNWKEEKKKDNVWMYRR